MDQTNDLALWPILRRIPNEFLILIDRFYIFNNGDSVLLFCKDGKVYGFGQNNHGMLGVQHDNLRQKYLSLLKFYRYYPCRIMDRPRELIKLRFQNIISISKGEKHMMALTELGDLYGWGANNSGQLGIGWYRSSSTEPTLILHDVQKVCCGPKHTVALIYDGSIRLWGKFPGCTPTYFTPNTLVRAPNSMVDLISTKFLTFAYNNYYDEDDKGAFYVWGDLKHFGLSTSSTVRFTYKRCDYNQIFKIIPLGLSKVLVLTYEGRVSLISIQNERVRSVRNPFRTMEFINFCIDIPDDPNVVILKDRDGECFIWDERRPQGYNLFHVHGITSVPDAACLYSSSFTPQITKLPSELIQKELSLDNQDDQFHKSNNNHNAAIPLEFNDPRLSDLVFRFVHYEYKPIYVHIAVMRQHSRYFHRNLIPIKSQQQQYQPNPIEQQPMKTIIIDDNSYISMFYYLRYIYTNQLPLEHFDDIMNVELYDISEKYQDERLQRKIVDHLYQITFNQQIATANQ